MNGNILLAPPITFILLVLLGMALSHFAASLSAHGSDSDRKLEAYACGQRNESRL